MTRLRYNNEAGTTGASLTSSETTITFAVAPDFATISGSDYIPICLDSGTATFEIVYLTAYTAAATTGTITRGAEDATNWPATSHLSGAAWTVAPVIVDLTVANITGAAPFASPALTGAPTAPTAAPLTDDTQLATTAYADLAVAAVGVSVVSKTTSYTATTHEFVQADASGGAFTITVPNTFDEITWVVKTDSSANAVTVAPSAGIVNGAATFVISDQYQCYGFIGNGTNVDVVSGFSSASEITLDQFGAAAANVSMGSNRLVSVAAAVAGTDAATLDQLAGVTVYTTSGTFTPSVSGLYMIACVAGGGGGGGGGSASTGIAQSGGGGGAQGEVKTQIQSLVALTAYTCTIGAGGAGGTGGAAGGHAGQAGTQGGTTTFAGPTTLAAQGGGLGQPSGASSTAYVVGGQYAGGASDQAGFNNPSAGSGGASQIGFSYSSAGGGAIGFGVGGGGGGGVSTSTHGGGGGYAASFNGTAGAGGNGASATTSGVAGAGAAAGSFGGGGGGGGGGTANTGAGGVGGAGAAGVTIIIGPLS